MLVVPINQKRRDGNRNAGDCRPIIQGKARADRRGKRRLVRDGDALPRNHTGTVVALADKLETLVGMFGVGNLPTGDKDPFALRRHALGVIRMLVEKQLPLDLPQLLQAASQTFGTLLPDPAKSNAQLLDFIYERVAGYLREHGASAQEADAVIAARPMWGEMPKALAKAACVSPNSSSVSRRNSPGWMAGRPLCGVVMAFIPQW